MALDIGGGGGVVGHTVDPDMTVDYIHKQGMNFAVKIPVLVVAVGRTDWRTWAVVRMPFGLVDFDYFVPVVFVK